METYFEKTIEDTFEDTAVVEACRYSEVALVVTETRDGRTYTADLALSPKRARKLAKALRRAADVAEGIAS